MRGKTRKFGDYLASRGWFDSGVQKVVRDWTDPLAEANAKRKLDAIQLRQGLKPLDKSVVDTAKRKAKEAVPERIKQTFLQIARRFEQQKDLTLSVRYGNDEQRYFIYDLIRAVDKLHHPNNPAGWVVKMCGASADCLTFSVDTITELLGFVKKLRRQSDPISAFLWQRFPPPHQEMLTNYPTGKNANKVPFIVALTLKQVIRAERVYDAERFRGVVLRPETKDQMKPFSAGPKLPKALLRTLADGNLPLINRLLLEDAYPLEFAKYRQPISVDPGRGLLPLTFKEMVIEIMSRGGPKFDPEILEKAAERIKLVEKEKKQCLRSDSAIAKKHNRKA